MMQIEEDHISTGFVPVICWLLKLSLIYILSWKITCLDVYLKLVDDNKAFTAVGSLINSHGTRLEDFDRSRLTNLRLVSASFKTSGLTTIFSSGWKTSTRDFSRKGTIGLLVWNTSRKPFRCEATSWKNCIFNGTYLSRWCFTNVSYEAFFGRLLFDKLCQCFTTFTIFGQSSIALLATSSSSTQHVAQNLIRRNWAIRELRLAEGPPSQSSGFVIKG